MRSIKALMVFAVLVIAFAASGFSQEKRLLTRAILNESLRQGIAFMVNNQKPEGNFNYEYDFVKNVYTDDDRQVRQAGAFWGLTLIYNDTTNRDLLPNLKRGFDFFRKHTVVDKSGKRRLVYPGPEQFGKSGAIGLIVLAYTEYLRTPNPLTETERKQYMKEQNEVLKFMLSLRMQDGHFYSKFNQKTGMGYAKPDPFFDGECTLALAKTAKYQNRKELIPLIYESAHKVFQENSEPDILKGKFSKLSTGAYQWNSMMLFEIATSGWEGCEVFGDYLLRMGHWETDVYKITTKPFTVAANLEGLACAAEYARIRGDMQAYRKFSDAIDQSLYVMTTWQVGGPVPNEYIRAHPTSVKYAVGGVMLRAADWPNLRIDMTQHQMHAVILARRFIYKQ